MKRKMWTLLTGDKYPSWYPEPMAKFFARFGVELHVFTDAPTPLDPIAKYYRVGHWPGEDLRTRCFGKVKFFDQNTVGEKEILVVDIDTVFVKSPVPIFEWVESPGFPSAAFVKDPIYKNHAGTSMFYLDFSKFDFNKVWALYREIASTPEKRAEHSLPGDQDLVTQAILRFQPTWWYFPRHFQVQSKIYFNLPVNKRWADAIQENQDLKKEEIISVHFVGRSNMPHEEVRKYPESFEEVNHPILEWPE
jgi:hypothetical protein